MKLWCEKYREEMDADQAVCRHPREYCKYRTSCIINFTQSDLKADEPADNAAQEVEMAGLRFDKGGGLLPAIAQDYRTGEILMLAYINKESWAATLATGKVHYWSRSRGKLWLKGESSGHYQLLKEVLVDCDEDTVIFKVEQLGGAACHTGYRSCFHRRLENDRLIVFGELLFNPAEVYKK